MRNPAGEKALLNDNLDTPNERYFEYLDWILDKAEEYGFYVLLLPVWGQLVTGRNWVGEQFDITVTAENAYRYGAWLGARYRGRNHILWCLGGDRQPIDRGIDYKNVWRRMAEGLAKGFLGKDLKYNQPDDAWYDMPLTYHPCHEAETGECSTMSYWTDEEAWISYIMLQSGHGLTPKNYELVEKEYNREKTMPVWDGEPAYEMMPTTWPITEDTSFHGSWMVRKRAYWALFSGAFGHTYGHGSMWCSISERERNVLNRYTWYEATQSEASAQIPYLRAFMDSMQIMTWKPCQEILLGITGEEKMDRHLQACIDADKESICVYLPSGGPVELNLKKIWKTETADEVNKEVYCWWYNPRDRKFYEDTGSVTEKPKIMCLADEKIQISAPGMGEEQDWIFIVRKKETGVPVKVRTYFEMKEESVQKVFEW